MAKNSIYPSIHLQNKQLPVIQQLLPLLLLFLSIQTANGMSTLVVGINPALQKRIILNTRLEPGNVHRAESIHYGIGGKGQNCAIALSLLLRGSTRKRSGVDLLQFIGSGENGDKVLSMLEKRFENNGVGMLTVRPKSEMRICTTIVTKNEATELIEPSGVVDSPDMIALMNLLRGSSGYNAMVIMGTMPPGCPVNTYTDIVKNNSHIFIKNNDSSRKQLLLIDSLAGLECMIHALKHDITGVQSMIKINVSEFCHFVGENSNTGKVIETVISAVEKFLTKFGHDAVQYIAITNGEHPSYFVEISHNNHRSFQMWQIDIPELPSVRTLYPIGAGDAVAAGTIAAWHDLEFEECMILNEDVRSIFSSRKDEYQEYPYLYAFGFGLACGSASCLQMENSVLDVVDVVDMFGRINPMKIEMK